MQNKSGAPLEVVFVCINNVLRSVAGEFIFRQMIQDMGLADKINVSGAGVCNDTTLKHFPQIRQIFKEHGRPKSLWGHPAYTGAINALAKRGIDASMHSNRELTKKIAGAADLIVCMSDMQKNYINSAYPVTKDKVFILDELSAPIKVSSWDRDEKHLSSRTKQFIWRPGRLPLGFTSDVGPHAATRVKTVESLLKEGGAGKKILLLLEF